jgi:hypothetical protein
MTHFKHSVIITDTVVRKLPWQWLNEYIGARLVDWDINWEEDGDSENNVVTSLKFKNKEDATRFVLTWL